MHVIYKFILLKRTTENNNIMIMAQQIMMSQIYCSYNGLSFINSLDEYYYNFISNQLFNENILVDCWYNILDECVCNEIT